MKLFKWFQRWLCLGVPKWTVECKLAPGATEGADPIKGNLWVCQVNEPGDPDANPPVPMSSTLTYEWWVGLTKTVVDQDFVDALEDCESCACGAPETWCQRTDTVRVDNHTKGEPRPDGPGWVPSPNVDQVWTLRKSNGQLHTYNYVGWDGTQQTATIANRWAWINTNISRALSAATGKPIKTRGAGLEYGVAGPDGDLGTPWGAFGWVDCCPGECTVVEFRVEIAEGPLAGVVEYLPVSFAAGEPVEYVRCLNCDGTETWTQAGAEVAKPEGCLFKDCAYPPAAVIPPKPDDACEFSDLVPVCEIDPGDQSDPDNETPPSIVTPGLFLQLIWCGTESTTNVVSFDANGDPVEHELTPDTQNFYGDCDDLTAFEDPPPPCPKGAVFECVEIQRHGVIVDNHGFSGGGLVNGTLQYTLEGELADGTTATATGTSWWPIRDVLQALGYSTSVVCANWGGCNPNGAQDPPPYIGSVPIEELFGRGWLGESCGSELVRIEIIEVTAGTAAAVGETRPLTIHRKDPEQLQRSINCDGVFWKSCDGKTDVVDPGCCALPCGAASSGTELPVGPSKCAATATGTCPCAITTSNYDPDQGSQWDAISVAGGVATITAGPNGTGSFSEQMAGTNPQCSGDMWLARMGAYDGPPGGGATLLAEGYVLGSRSNANGSAYTLGEPVVPFPCDPQIVETALVAAGFSPVEAASLSANGHAGVDVLATAGATHINGVFDNTATTPFGLCITLDTADCEDTEPGDDVVYVEDSCLAAKLDTLIAETQTTNSLLTTLIGCLCGKPCGGPLGDQTICATEKMGATFTSELPGQGIHTLDSLFISGAVPVIFSGTFTVIDNLGGSHTFTNGATVNGMAVGATQDVFFTGTVEFVKDDETFRCTVTDKAISANFTVEA